MTSTRAINAAAGVIHAAMQQGKTLPQTIAYALDSAGLLNSPEIAAELEHLRKRVAELEAAAGDGSTRTADEDPITYALTAEAEALHASSGAVIPVPSDDVRPQVAKLQSFFAGGREETYQSPLHHDYAVPHDLPDVTS